MVINCALNDCHYFMSTGLLKSPHRCEQYYFCSSSSRSSSLVVVVVVVVVAAVATLVVAEHRTYHPI